MCRKPNLYSTSCLAQGYLSDLHTWQRKHDLSVLLVPSGGGARSKAEAARYGHCRAARRGELADLREVCRAPQDLKGKALNKRVACMLRRAVDEADQSHAFCPLLAPGRSGSLFGLVQTAARGMALSMAQSAFTGAALHTRAPTARAAAPAFTVRAAQSLQVRGQLCVARAACAQLCAALATPRLARWCIPMHKANGSIRGGADGGRRPCLCLPPLRRRAPLPCRRLQHSHELCPASLPSHHLPAHAHAHIFLTHHHRRRHPCRAAW